jgi:hypothetical protein
MIVFEMPMYALHCSYLHMYLYVVNCNGSQNNTARFTRLRKHTDCNTAFLENHRQ